RYLKQYQVLEIIFGTWPKVNKADSNYYIELMWHQDSGSIHSFQMKGK
ncbi:15273_t:CDS:1, partial [Gigaspora rosea]